MSNGARDITDIPAYYDYLVGLGFSFHIFKEEPEYDTFTSYSPRGFILPTGGSYSTARQHFIEMITETTKMGKEKISTQIELSHFNWVQLNNFNCDIFSKESN